MWPATQGGWGSCRTKWEPSGACGLRGQTGSTAVQWILLSSGLPALAFCFPAHTEKPRFLGLRCKGDGSCESGHGKQTVLSSQLRPALSQLFSPAEGYIASPGVLREGDSPQGTRVSPVSRSNMFEAPCSWAWIPAGSGQMTEGSTHSSRLQFVQSFIVFLT